jgi:hypothetical protein
MAAVNKNSIINITRRIGTTVENLYNKLFNGYIYNMSLDVGYDGQPTVLTLNLALNRTIDQVKVNSDVIKDRKKDITYFKNLIAAQKSVPQNSVGNLGSVPAGSQIGPKDNISQISDKDFNIDQNYIGVTCSYDIGIYDGLGNPTYSFKSFKIVSFSISKKNDQKILTLVLKDNSFVLDKVYVGLLGNQVAIDGRSESLAYVSGIKISCPPVGSNCPAGLVTLNNQPQYLHFSNSKFKNSYQSHLGTIDLNANAGNVGSDRRVSLINFQVGDDSSQNKKHNFVTISSIDPNKSIFKGYGAAIILGEEEFKDSPCGSAEVYYSFETLIAAMKKLGIVIAENNRPANLTNTSANYDSLQDKSRGKIKKNYQGTLRQVLNQWCDDYGYSYCVDYTKTSDTSFVLKGIDKTSGFSKELILQTKLTMEDLESSTSNSDFVIRSEDFSYDLSQQQLKLFSSYYSKDAKDKTLNYKTLFGNEAFNNIRLDELYPDIFGNRTDKKDFSGSYRTYEDVVISAILGKYSSRLREIYNYSIGAYGALGFIPFNGIPNSSQIPLLAADASFSFIESISSVLDYQSENFFASDGTPLYDLTLGFYNEELAQNVLAMESFIADFLGRYYWTPELEMLDGESGNTDFYAKYEVGSSVPVQKIMAGQLYQLDVFKKARYLLNSIASVFSGNNDNYFKAYYQLADLAANAQSICSQVGQDFINLQGSQAKLKKFRFFYERSGATYGVIQDFLEDVLKLKYTIAGSTTASAQEIDVATIFAPVFKELSPVSLGLLQAAMPINISNVAIGSFKFGVLLGLKPAYQVYNISSQNARNILEIQNSIYNRCSEILKINTTGVKDKLIRNKRSCSKTLLYEVCVRSCEDSGRKSSNDNAVSFASGPNPYFCFAVKITRDLRSPAVDSMVLQNVYKTVISSNTPLSLDGFTDKPSQILVTSLRLKAEKGLTNISYDIFSKTASYQPQWELIVAPSQENYSIPLYTETTTETFLPARNYVLGGLESLNDVIKIIENPNFSVDVTTSNLTPNVRELYGDETTPQYVSAPVSVGNPSSYPVFIEYQGYEGTNPKYQFRTLSEFHNSLKAYYDSKNISLSQPNIKFSADIFCSSIPSQLKDLLTVQNGLTKLNINLAENGLSINCSFESSPTLALSQESLILKNRPNIKLVNPNFFK